MKKIILLLAGVLVMSCGLESKPDHLLSREKMVDLLYDMTVYHSMQSYNFNVDTLYVYHKRSDILDKYGLDSIQFEAQHEYYRRDLDDYSKMYKEVQDRLLAKVEEIKALPNDKEDEKDVATESLPFRNKVIKNSASTNVETAPKSEKTE